MSVFTIDCRLVLNHAEKVRNCSASMVNVGLCLCVIDKLNTAAFCAHSAAVYFNNCQTVAVSMIVVPSNDVTFLIDFRS